MIRVTAVALVVLACCDFVAFGGQYTADVLKILSALERAVV